jgi:signal transduction histidine kinase
MGNLELLEAQSLTPAQREMLTSIARGSERIKNLSQSLLAFSRPAQEDMVPLSANDVIERGLELCHYQIVKAGVQLEKRLDPAGPRVLGVANQLEMALINLAVNAIQAMTGTSGGRLTVSSARRGDEVEIAVADTGPGIPETIRNNIFEPFVTTKPEGRGTGLGLSTVLMVVERHRGRIDFASAPGGTTFRVSLPAAP